MKAAAAELHWTPFRSLLRREIGRFLKVVVQTVITPFVNSTLYLLIFGVSLGGQIELKGHVPYLSFLIPGLVMMACLNNSFQNTSSSIISSKFSGDLEDLRVTPLSPTQIAWALSLAALVRGLLVGSITFFIGEMAFHLEYARWLPVVHPFALLFFLLVGSLAFANLGIVIAFWAKSFDQLGAVSGFVLQPLIYLGGVFFSIEHLPHIWRVVSLWNPLLYVINGVRFGILGMADVQPMQAVWVSVAGFSLTFFLSMRSLRYGNFQRW